MKMIVFLHGFLQKKLVLQKMMQWIKKVIFTPLYTCYFFTILTISYLFLFLLFLSVNYGNLLLQALLEHWWRPLHVDDENEGNSNDGNGSIHTRGGNLYFSVPTHTPVIFRYKSILNIFFNGKKFD